jgi:hypothetical protein
MSGLNIIKRLLAGGVFQLGCLPLLWLATCLQSELL